HPAPPAPPSPRDAGRGIWKTRSATSPIDASTARVALSWLTGASATSTSTASTMSAYDFLAPMTRFTIAASSGERLGLYAAFSATAPLTIAPSRVSSATPEYACEYGAYDAFAAASAAAVSGSGA